MPKKKAQTEPQLPPIDRDPSEVIYYSAQPTPAAPTIQTPEPRPSQIVEAPPQGTIIEPANPATPHLWPVVTGAPDTIATFMGQPIGRVNAAGILEVIQTTSAGRDAHALICAGLLTRIGETGALE